MGLSILGFSKLVVGNNPGAGGALAVPSLVLLICEVCNRPIIQLPMEASTRVLLSFVFLCSRTSLSSKAFVSSNKSVLGSAFPILLLFIFANIFWSAFVMPSALPASPSGTLDEATLDSDILPCKLPSSPTDPCSPREASSLLELFIIDILVVPPGRAGGPWPGRAFA